MACLKCTKQSNTIHHPSSGINCDFVMATLDHQRFKKEELEMTNVGLQEQCPVPAENTDSLLKEGKSVSEILHSIFSSIKSKFWNDQEYMHLREPENLVTEHCKGISFCLTNILLCALVGSAICCPIFGFIFKFWRRRKVMPLHQHSLHQNQQLQVVQQKQQQQSPISGKWRMKLLLAFVIAGVTGSIWLFWHLNEDIVLRRQETLSNMCDERARMLQDQFNVSMNHVHALAILISTFHHGKQPSAIDQKTFGEYTERTAFERPLTSGVAYALRVPHSQREQFETQHGWKIKKMETEDQTLVQDCIPENLDPAPVQDEYAPVIFSQETVSHIVSIDMMSGKEDRENILRARASGKGVLTSPFKLLKSNHLGVVLTFAVYNTHLPPHATAEQFINATVGYLGASYDVPSLVEKLLHQLASKQTIVVNVYDTTNKAEPINMYGTNVTDTGLLHISTLDFGDPTRKHEMHCRFKQRAPPPWTAITASVGVLVITLLLGHIFRAAITRIAEAELGYQNMRVLMHRAEAADKAKSQFLATVSHEIRTPMNGVLGMLQMLMDTNLDANQLDYAQTAHASGRDLISLINEVLDQAKIESGRLELEAVPFDLRAVLDNVLSLFSTKSHEKGIELAVYVSNQVPEIVIGDPGRLRQIITNLVGNSIKFTQDRGHIFVSVHLADEVGYPLEEQDEVLRPNITLVENCINNSRNTLSGFPVVNRWKSWKGFGNLNVGELSKETEMVKVLVTVEDTGVGIPQEAQGHIFMPFMQADSSTSRTYGGTGIGLSISKRLVDLMGGEIGFDSEPGTGSTFSFSVAFKKGEQNSPDLKSPQYRPTVSEFQGLRALVIDGKSIRAEVTRYHLQRLGISVEKASTLDSAYASLTCNSKTSISGQLAMILVDQDVLDEMTDTSYNKILKELRPNRSSSILEIGPKILLMAPSSSEKCNKLKSAGLVDAVLTKPLRLSVLILSFQETLSFDKKRPPSRSKPSTLGNLLRDKRILVVDDNMVNRRVAEGALKKYGAVVTCVDSGRSSLKMLNPPHNFDACFMDLQMPEMDGFEATRQIRCLESEVNKKINSGEASIEMYGNVAHWHTPILAMTADVIQATNEECTKCGMDGYVSKPFEEEELYSAAARFFDSEFMPGAVWLSDYCN
ncbi:histidine kinase 2 isoform X2 [Daucus carota subsp. sativus]